MKRKSEPKLKTWHIYSLSSAAEKKSSNNTNKQIWDVRLIQRSCWFVILAMTSFVHLYKSTAEKQLIKVSSRLQKSLRLPGGHRWLANMGAAVVLCNKRKLLRRLASWTSLLYWPPRMTTLGVVIFLHYNILQRKWKMQHFGMWDLLILCWFGFPTLCREFGMIFSPNLWTCDAAWRTPHHLACETLTKAVMPVNASLHLHLPQYMKFL